MPSLASMSVLRNVSRIVPIICKPQARLISTSKKNRDTATVTTDMEEKTVCEVDKRKNWVSYGFSVDDYEEDRFHMHVVCFSGISLMFCVGGFLLIYRPDDLGKDWAQREAYIQLRHREKLGLPLIDPDYIPEDKIILPSDEELGDTEIVV